MSAPIAEAARKLDARQAFIDGNTTVHGNTGLPDFQAPRPEFGDPRLDKSCCCNTPV
jgi:hypothetical protein